MMPAKAFDDIRGRVMPDARREIVSIVVIVALELRGVTKRFTVGTGSCVAWADVLRGATLGVAAGEAIALAGPRGSGKSTLMLCAAGLLRHDGGDVRWFGESERAVAARRVNYRFATEDLMHRRCVDQPTIHLLDLPDTIGEGRGVARWIEQRRDAGDAVIVTTRDEDLAHHLAPRVVVLRGGRVYPVVRPRSRVAEYARR